jgi:hypothetical protein
VGGVAGGIASELVSNFLRGGGLVVRLYDSWCGLAPVLDPPEFILYCFVICLFPPGFFGQFASSSSALYCSSDLDRFPVQLNACGRRKIRIFGANSP